MWGSDAVPYLQYAPSRSVAFGAGGVFAGLVVTTAAVAALARARVFAVAGLGSACVAASLFLRGASSSGSAAAVRRYEASLALAACGANLLLALALVLLSRWVRILDGARSPAVRLAAAAGVGVALAAAALECAGVPLAFGADARQRHVGRALRIAAAAATLGCSGAGVAATAYKAAAGARPMAAEVLGLALPFALVGVWGAFAVARVALAPRGAANTSEVAFYLLGVVPLALALLAWIAVNAPRLFGDGKRLPPAHRPPARWSGHYDSHYRYPSLPAEHDYSYPVRVPRPPPDRGPGRIAQAVRDRS